MNNLYGAVAILVAAMAVSGCGPGPKDVLRLWGKGDLAAIKKMALSDNEADVAAVASAWPAEPAILSSTTTDALKNPLVPPEKVARFYRLAAKKDPHKFADFVDSFAKAELAPWEKAARLYRRATGEGTPNSADLARTIVHRGLTPWDDAGRYLLIAVEAAAAATATGVAAGSRDLACAGPLALKTYLGALLDGEESQGTDATIRKAAMASCAEMEGVRQELSRAMTLGGIQAVPAMRRARRAIQIARVIYPQVDSKAVETFLNVNIKQCEGRDRPPETILRLGVELRTLQEDRKGYAQINGYIVAALGDRTYEATNVTWYQVIEYQHSYYSHTHPRAILITTQTSFNSRGRFSLWAKNTGSQKFEMSNGFAQTFPVWKETGSPAELDRKIAVLRKEIGPYRNWLKIDAEEDDANRKAAREALVPVRRALDAI